MLCTVFIYYGEKTGANINHRFHSSSFSRNAKLNGQTQQFIYIHKIRVIYYKEERPQLFREQEITLIA